jgi:beta-phosphoglucomutase-like phosphatase (HAD superfamily)
MPVPTPDAPCLAIFDHDGVLVDSLEFHSRRGSSWAGARGCR